jgi:hypothetical protein
VVDPRSLDALDPPPWGQASADATFLVRRCHELRQEPIDGFTVADLRLMIGQRVGLPQLVPLALNKLQIEPLASGDYFPGDLLSNVLLIDTAFWTANPKLATDLRAALDAIPVDAPVAQDMDELIAAFRVSQTPSSGA